MLADLLAVRMVEKKVLLMALMTVEKLVDL
jgi:hypothetical protein